MKACGRDERMDFIDTCLVELAHDLFKIGFNLFVGAAFVVVGTVAAVFLAQSITIGDTTQLMCQRIIEGGKDGLAVSIFLAFSFSILSQQHNRFAKIANLLMECDRLSVLELFVIKRRRDLGVLEDNTFESVIVKDPGVIEAAVEFAPE